MSQGEDSSFIWYFLDGTKKNNDDFYQRNLSGTIFNKNVKNFTPMSVTKKITKWIPIGTLVTKKDL